MVVKQGEVQAAAEDTARMQTTVGGVSLVLLVGDARCDAHPA